MIRNIVRFAVQFMLFPSPLQLVWVISSAILIGFVYGGLKLLKRQEYGRSLIIFLAIIDIPHLVVGKAIFNNFGITPMYLRNYFLIWLSVLIDFLLVYFLYHPKVREEFE